MASSSTQPARVQFPENDVAPLGRILQRFALAIALIVLVALLAYFGRDGYVDAAEDGITLIDAFYYSTVSITTTGYGDVRPESQGARLLTTLIVTPARILFLIMLVGTTLEVLAARTRTAYRITNWRSRLSNHVVICGYGTKGRNAAIAMLERGRTREQIVVIDGRPEARALATADGFVAVAGDASRGGARGRERPPAAPERRDVGDRVLERRRTAARARHAAPAARRDPRGPALGGTGARPRGA
jgi:voltage-gated potassium channel